MARAETADGFHGMRGGVEALPHAGAEKKSISLKALSIATGISLAVLATIMTVNGKQTTTGEKLGPGGTPGKDPGNGDLMAGAVGSASPEKQTTRTIPEGGQIAMISVPQQVALQVASMIDGGTVELKDGTVATYHFNQDGEDEFDFTPVVAKDVKGGSETINLKGDDVSKKDKLRILKETIALETEKLKKENAALGKKALEKTKECVASMKAEEEK